MDVKREKKELKKEKEAEMEEVIKKINDTFKGPEKTKMIEETLKKIDSDYKGIEQALERFQKIQDKFKNKKILTQKEIEEILKETCWGGLQYCCGGEKKKCMNRDFCLSMVGWTFEDYEKYKDKCKELFFKMLKKA